MKIWGVRFYIINVRVKRKKLDDISHHGYLMGYEDTKELFYTLIQINLLLSTDTIMFSLMNIIPISP